MSKTTSCHHGIAGGGPPPVGFFFFFSFFFLACFGGVWHLIACLTTSFFTFCVGLCVLPLAFTWVAISSRSVCFHLTVTELFSLLNNASALSSTSSNKQRTSSSVKLEVRCLLELSTMTQFSSSLFEISGFSSRNVTNFSLTSDVDSETLDVAPQSSKYASWPQTYAFVELRCALALRVRNLMRNCFHLRIRQDLGPWNCSVPHWPRFKRHFRCNMRLECANEEDEAECPYSFCDHGLVRTYRHCYF